MTPAQFQTAAIKIFGRKKWAPQVAAALGVDRVTIYRLMKRETVAGPYEVAINGMLQNKSARDKLEKEARKLLPRKFRKRPLKSKRKTDATPQAS